MTAQTREGLSLRLGHGATQALTSTVAALIAYLPARALGLQEGFWGAITAIAVVQAELQAVRTSARDQFTGAALGSAVAACFVALWGQHIGTFAAALCASMMLCWLLAVPTAARLAGVTATIICLVPHPGNNRQMVLSRVLEVGWGVSVALGTVWAANCLPSRLRNRRVADGAEPQ